MVGKLGAFIIMENIGVFMIIYNLDEENLDPTNLLEDWALDYSIFSLKFKMFNNRHELWRRFIRS